MTMNRLSTVLLFTTVCSVAAFTVPTTPSLHHSLSLTQKNPWSATVLSMAEGDDNEEKAAPLVSGADLEMMLTELDQPLVIDAYATWCGPCLLMAPEFEAAAKELKGKVRFAKLDTDKDEQMAARLQIMGLPTLLFLDKFEADENATTEEEQNAKAVLKGRLEGALRKQDIMDLCEHYFFGGPAPSN